MDSSEAEASRDTTTEDCVTPDSTTKRKEVPIGSTSRPSSAKKVLVPRSETGGENALPIPIDLVFEIFTRLPVKSIARCRCVSKIWASMLRRREFTQLFSSKSYARPQLLFARKTWSELLVFSSPQPQNPDETSPPIVCNYHMKFSFGLNCTFSGVNGLVCVIINKSLPSGRNETFPVIFNPSTGESLPLKKVRSSRGIMRSMFGYDPIDKGFKILSMTKGPSGRGVDEEHQVLTLGTDKWRMLEDCIPGGYRSLDKGELCINGVLYYQSICSPEDISAICCFDIRSEKFRFIKFNETIPLANLINYSGKLGLLWSERADPFVDFFDQSSTSLRLWVLEDVERQEWFKRNIMSPPLWKDLVGEHSVSVVGVTSTNEIVFKSLYRPVCLLYLNTVKSTIVRVRIQGMDSNAFGGLYIFMNHVEDVKLNLALCSEKITKAEAEGNCYVPLSELLVEDSWLKALPGELHKPYAKTLSNFLEREIISDCNGPPIYPPHDLIFNALNTTPFDRVKAVIIGQDPYHGPGQAMGLSFSVPEGEKLPCSLLSIFKELQKDVGCSIPRNGNLQKWAVQGVLLLNAVLTVRSKEPNSHAKKGWEQFTDAVIQSISQQKEGVVFLLWGRCAQEKSKLIDGKKHHVLKAAHPSAHRGFFNCRHFSRANQLLEQMGIPPIDWQL